MFNDALGAWCEEHGIPFIRIHQYLADESGCLKKTYETPDRFCASADTVFFVNDELAKFYPEEFGCG